MQTDIRLRKPGCNPNTCRNQRKALNNNADSIISVGRKCRDAGISKVNVASIVHRKRPRFLDVLKGVCAINGFRFINNANINNSDICDDLLHLKYHGTCKLASNFINGKVCR